MNYVFVDEIIKRAFAEDFPYGDITSESLIDPCTMLDAALVCKEDGVIAGIEVFERVYALLGDVTCQFFYKDGETIRHNQKIAKITGNAINLLKGERIALNFIQRLSGIASMTRKYTEALSGCHTKLLDTRKTTPGMRYLEKYAVTIGGGVNHRFSLSDGILIKDNHIVAVGGIKPAVEKARSLHGFVRKIEVEVETLEMVKEALEAGADIIMLDNMDIDTMKKAVALIDGRAMTECSGNINFNRLQALNGIGLDFISCGSLTHSYSSLDISLRII
ncbi:MAG: carboxylating nicotinate-nucleotide diphosphorylase [Defluviitaleaceae bacterium]|nr:carboxylating nicotinate-nucleotide diphosphorylase [Defluviitaleaceae bacterium]